MIKQEFTISVLVFMLVAQLSWAEIPQTISYQGILTDDSSVIVPDGTYSLTFSIYNVETLGTPLWTEAHPSVEVKNGVFNVILGSVTPLNISFDAQYWLEVEVNSAILSPRVKLTSAAYSLNARSVADGAVTTAKLADGAATTAKIQPDVVSSVDGVSNDGGNVDLIPQNTVTINPNDTANTITIGETHSSALDNPHNTTAAQTGALVSVDGVSNPGGNIDLVPGSNISITPNDGVDTITVSATGLGDITSVNAGTGLTAGSEFGDATLSIAVPLSLSGPSIDAIISGTNTTSGLGVHGVSTGGYGVRWREYRWLWRAWQQH